ncbi:hypothetical protein DBR32_12600 [Taibaiella sp. KBW10]|nr:hypothetical protein DBR32_12600 [Taibaiella sp. KBW10]
MYTFDLKTGLGFNDFFNKMIAICITIFLVLSNKFFGVLGLGFTFYFVLFSPLFTVGLFRI